MKIQFTSDIHLEFSHQFLPENVGSDVLILAGDILTAHGIVNTHSKNRRYRRFFQHISDNWKHVIYVAGNHEAYNYKRGSYLARVRDFLAQWTNVTMLEKQHVHIGDTAFVGGTLWTDFFRGDPIAKLAVQRGMNDYHVTSLTPDMTEKTHHETVAYIREIAGKAEKVVVVTHHAPSSQSSLPMYAGDILNAGYYSDLSGLILDNPSIRLWFHGHMHNSSDYMIGDCRVLANPHAYPHEKNRDFDMGKIVEI